MARPDCGICKIIEGVRSGSNRDLVAELEHSFVILGDAQFYRGYCILVAKRHATELHLLPDSERRALLDEVVAVGIAIFDALKPIKLNYECLGNTEPHVHWHVFPRYESDPLRKAPVWVRPEAERKVTLEDSDRRALISAVRRELARLLPAARFPTER